MKLRVRGDSLRLRLTRTEVETLASTHRVEQCMRALGGTLAYAIAARPGAPIGASLAHEGDLTRVTVTLEAGAVAAWAVSEQVGFEATQDLGDGTRLAILVEKDFACLAPREEQDDDAYENPAASA